MIGRVDDALNATLDLRLRTPDGAAVGEFVATIDPGFSEFLLLSHDVIEPLGLMVQEQADIGLGDGSMTKMDVVAMDVLWLDGWRTVRVHVADSDPLIGASLLVGAGRGGQWANVRAKIETDVTRA